jgi:GTP-binding protein
MIIRSAEFLKSGLNPADFPQTTFPEIAFAGRSNVGKSSLINALLGRKNLVRTSRTPGQTRTLNFFLVNDQLIMVDLPGYGYSRAPKEVIRQYREATRSYINTRKPLVLIALLLDLRRIPSLEDKAFLQLVHSSHKDSLIVLTKADSVGRGSWSKAWVNISKELPGPGDRPIFFSTQTGEGREIVWNAVEERLKGGRLI